MILSHLRKYISTLAIVNIINRNRSLIGTKSLATVLQFCWNSVVYGILTNRVYTFVFKSKVCVIPISTWRSADFNCRSDNLTSTTSQAAYRPPVLLFQLRSATVSCVHSTPQEAMCKFTILMYDKIINIWLIYVVSWLLRLAVSYASFFTAVLPPRLWLLRAYEVWRDAELNYSLKSTVKNYL